MKIFTTDRSCSPIEEAASLGTQLLEFLDNIIVTLGADGILIVRRGLATDKFRKTVDKNYQISARHYPAEYIKDFINVSGAGDCFASGFIRGMLAQQSEEICMSIGFASAKKALYSSSAVPTKIFDRSHSSWKTPAVYNTLNNNAQ